MNPGRDAVNRRAALSMVRRAVSVRLGPAPEMPGAVRTRTGELGHQMSPDFAGLHVQ